MIVAGLADTDQSSRLHVAVADGPGWDGGWLTSPSTGRDGYVQLVDLAPTALAALGRPQPERLFAGQPAPRRARPARRPARRGHASPPTPTARRAPGVPSRPGSSALLAFAQFALAVAVVPLLRRARRQAGRRRPAAAPDAVARSSCCWSPRRWRSRPRWSPTRCRGGAAARPGWSSRASPCWCSRWARWRCGSRRSFGRTLGPLGGGRRRPRRWSSASTCSPARGCSSTASPGTRRWRATGTPAWARSGWACSCPGCCSAPGCLAQRVPRSWRPAVVAVVGGARRAAGRQPVPRRRPGRRGRADRRRLHRDRDLHRRLALARPAGRRHGRRAARDGRVRGDRPAPAGGGAGQPRADAPGPGRRHGRQRGAPRRGGERRGAAGQPADRAGVGRVRCWCGSRCCATGAG